MASKRKELNTSQRAQIIGAWKVGQVLGKSLRQLITLIQLSRMSLRLIKIKELLSLLLYQKG